MTGPHDSIIGVEVEAALGRFLTGLPARFETATGNPRLNAVIVEADEQTGRPTDIERLSYSAERAWSTSPMPDLFDLPFEDDPETDPEPGARGPRSSTEPHSAGALRCESDASGPSPSSPSASAICSRPSSPKSGSRASCQDCRVWNTGHLYFTLKDGSSQIKAVIFRSALRYLKFKPADGLRVVARGRVSVYEPKGEYQLVCEHLEPHGLGALQLAFDQLKKRLQDEGLFEAERKRPLPALPRKIGIVTSLDGAAIRDIIKVLRRRYANAHLVICPARVQGEDAAPEIARALRPDRARRRRRRRHRRPRRRIDRGSVGVQRRSRRAGDRRGRRCR